MPWRLIQFQALPAAMNMAVDECLTERVAKGSSPPTVRLYGWHPSAVSIGRFQCLADEVDTEECARRGVDLVRRRTGGGAVYHDRSGEITYSVAAPDHEMPSDINLCYRKICGCLVNALGSLGVAAEFRPINDILVGGKKISGSALTRRGGAFLQHGTLLLSVDTRVMFSLLKVSRAKALDKDIASVEERVTALDRHCAASRGEVLAALEGSFRSELGCVRGSLTDAEIRRAEEIAAERFGSWAWTSLR
ncbi:MAG: lipoate--protein ligase family protein [Methanomassiliicoccales archaeon]|nr:lipoate--protein ligase family protein [Methanomassiliicoccales archaeon]